jgi:oxygen-dependent protoporphyrinogen oxidase
MKIAIVGAGISGLSAAFYLKQQLPECSLTIFDSGSEPGGTMQTINMGGFLFEGGGNGFLTNKPDSLQLVRDSGAEHLLMPSSDLARKRYIYHKGMHRLPESPPLFLKSGLLTLGQKLRVAGEFFVPKKVGEAEETLQQFGYRRVGKGFTDVFLDAMVAGIYATTPDRVSVQAAFPMVVALEREYGGLFRGMLAKRKKGAGPGGVLTSFRGGVGSFVSHLAGCLEAEWRLGFPVSDVQEADKGYRVTANGSSETFDQVIVGAPAFAAADMLSGMDPDLGAKLADIEYSPVAVVGFGYESLAHPLDGFGLLTTSAAGLPILGVLWDSSIFPDRAPDGAKSVRIMIGGQRNPELVALDDQQLVGIAREGLLKTMGIDENPDAIFVRRWERGIPSYAPGHLGRVANIFKRLDTHPGLHLCANAYGGIAMNDCVRNGRELASRIAGAAA